MNYAVTEVAMGDLLKLVFELLSSHGIKTLH